MATKTPAVEIEIDGEHNEQLRFRPLQRNVRGRFDMQRIGEPMSKVAASQWPLAIPSQRLGIDRDGTGYLMEPLHDDAHAPTREKIVKQGMALEPAMQTFGPVHLPTWQFWLKSAVDAGLAKVVSGNLPETIEGTPRMNFVVDHQPSMEERLAASFDALTAAIVKLVESKDPPPLSRWADAALREQNADLQTELDAERRRFAVAETEIETMAAVIARDRARIKAEGAAYARQRAEAEGIPNEQRDYESPGRRIA